ncbi:Biosynthetic Aromatic amino acid aminotransferase beta [Hyphomicrobium sulfonivorans]|uniref:histidinol-phosphate transaminase n=1 Tax=Hyphomicrobium sulfonivorans TaxID=121290 RepID=A0A109B9X7_HYPSL|nr:pyridoxal phosphate-dependent aminotransferase [Hyphomicrobium sulfonivorans]KWT64883.1 Biosynthetic Aromatic amino acid aminotransferase beta [Hyphomicrobium sulfonivorans]
MAKPRLTPLIESLPAMVPFVGPEALVRARGKPFRARIGANENVFGPSPRAIAAMAEAAAGNWMYADPESFELREALAQFHGVDRANIVVGEGIDGLLGLTVKLTIDPGDTVVTSNGTYPTFNFHVAAAGGRLVRVPYRDDRQDLGALLDAAIAEDARLLYVCNPDNPMGSFWQADKLQELIAALPDGLLLCLDEAYCDTATAMQPLAFDVGNSQVIRMRTFSKAYGLAGARIGYAVGEAGLIAQFEKVRNHYGINRVGQIGALAALGDQAYLADVVGRIDRARGMLGDIALRNGLQPLPSGANFVAMDCGHDGAYARRVLDGLLARDVFARMPGTAGLDRCIRVSCGTDADLDVFAAALPQAIADADAE